MFDLFVIAVIVWSIFGVVLVKKMSRSFKWYRVEISVVGRNIPNFSASNVVRFKGGYVSCSERECIVGFCETGDFVLVRFGDEKIIFEGFDRHLVEEVSKEFVRRVSGDGRG